MMVDRIRLLILWDSSMEIGHLVRRHSNQIAYLDSSESAYRQVVQERMDHQVLGSQVMKKGVLSEVDVEMA